MPRRGKDYYGGISFQPPAPVAAAARRALERRAQQPPSNRGMTPVGLARARQLANRQELSPTTIDRMMSYFARLTNCIFFSISGGLIMDGMSMEMAISGMNIKTG